MEQPEKMPLKTFWEAVEQRLAAYSADELRTILRAMAQETPPADRQYFLARLAPVAEAAPPPIQEDELLAAIDDCAREIADAMQHADAWERRYEWGEYYDDEDSLGPYEEFVEPLAGLFDQAEAAFDYGHLALARAAYHKLFDLLSIEDDYGRGVRVTDLAGVDTGEASARYLRAVYETESPDYRPAALFEQLRQVQGWLFGRRPALNDLVQISPRPLPDQERFLADWIAYLRTQPSPSGSDADAWLREAVRLAQGTAGLADLAQTEGRTRPRAYLDWFAALEQEGRLPEVLAAAQAALQTLPTGLPIRAAIADHLCATASQLHDPAALRHGRWEAFVARPSLLRLLDLWELAADPAERATLMPRAAAYLQDYGAQPPAGLVGTLGIGDGLEQPAWIGPAVLAHAYLLAGDWDAAQRLVARGQVLGWSSTENAQGLVVAASLVLLSGQSLGALPANLAQVWQWGLQYSVVVWGEDKAGVIQRLERAYAEQFPLVRLSIEQQERLLAWCLDVAQQR
ncbi:MAG: hypothetical protein KKA73_16735, partial [Chloroflexi bacterium]|nr:hypothetical protein [Chloroflexota bacterium]